MALMGEVERLRDELKKSQARIEFLERQIERDDLTPCNNRRGFVHELTRQIDFTERYGEPSSLIYIDLNGFKAINDTHGHLAGDAVLIQVASVLMDGRRVAGVRSSDYVGRLGGDEFGVILAQADETRAWDKAVQLAGAIAATATKWKESELRVDAAYGVHTFRSGIDAMAALAAADADMYNRKRQRDKAK
ncbi:MAG: GGDEF domain-containing protein [Alphaproteobacteria bacterium]|nr:GGDEF domain-containing protein [Alphaproteobacteria bacterium]